VSAGDTFAFFVTGYNLAQYNWYDGFARVSERTHDAAIPIEGIDPSFVLGLVIALISVSVVAFFSILYLLEAKGKVRLPKLKMPAFRRI
jgi:hypothetical protein